MLDTRDLLEAATEKAFVEYVENVGGECLKLKIDGAKGFPDRTVFLPNGEIMFIEFKREKDGTISPHQYKWINKLTALGFTVHVCYNFAEAKSAVRDCATDYDCAADCDCKR